MSFGGYRDIIQRREQRLNSRQERRRQWRAVIVDAQGNQSGTGSIWADEATRRLWVMPVGGGNPYQVLCMRIGMPVIGLGVIVGFIEGSNIQEVLRDDYEFLGPSNNGISWLSPTDNDFKPGGRMQLWIQSKMIQPLATYPVSGLTVGVVSGDYLYASIRKTYTGTTSKDLTSSQPSSGEHRYVGLYLDSANTLQTVNGTAVAVAGTPPEPTWPDGAFRLSVVRIANPQTSIVLANNTDSTNDIFDRRIGWLDVDSFGGWPFDNVLTVSQTDANADYSSLSAALSAASAGDVLLLDAETFTLTANFDVTKAITIIGHPGGSIINTSTNSLTLITLSAAAKLYNLTITNSGAGSGGAGVFWTASGVVLDGCTITVSGAGTTNYGIGPSGAVTGTVRDCTVTVSGGTNNYGFAAVVGNSTTEIDGGKFSGSTYDIYGTIAGATVKLGGPRLANTTVSFTGTVNGDIFDTNGKPVGIDRGPLAAAAPSNDMVNITAASDSDFVSTIATLPGGAVLTYGAVTAGAAGNLVAASSSHITKLVLHNTTRGTNALIQNTVTGTSTITLTANVPAGWQVGDAITIRSQTNTATPFVATSFYVDFEFTSDLDTYAGAMFCYGLVRDTGAAGQRLGIHPYEANNNAKLRVWRSQVANVTLDFATPPVPIISRRFCLTWDASGAGTMLIIFKLAGEVLYL